MSNCASLLSRSRRGPIRGLLSARELVVALLLGAGSVTALQAQDSTSFTFVASVFDAQTGKPVVAAFAAALGTERFATTDQHGSFRIDGLPPGRNVIRVWRLGYRPTLFTVRFDSVQTSILDAPIVLEPIPVQMPEVVIEADRTRLIAGPLKDFFRRRSAGRGWFMTREEIEARRGDQFVDLVRLVPVADIQYLGGLQNTVRLVPTCPPLYYLDGIQTNEPLVLSLRPERIAGIEVYYRPAEMPAEFNVRGSACGVIVVWTHH